MNNTINNTAIESETYSELFKGIARATSVSEVEVDGKKTEVISEEMIYCDGHLCSKKFFDMGELVREDIYAGTGEVVCTVSYSKGRVTKAFCPKTSKESKF